MASRVAQLPNLDSTAAAIYISNAQEFHEPNAIHPPMVLIPGEQDPGNALGSNIDLVNQINNPDMALVIPNPPQPVTNGLFTRIPGIDCETSVAIKQALLDGGFLDATTEMVTQDPKLSNDWKLLLPTDLESYVKQISDVLVEAFAGH